MQECAERYILVCGQVEDFGRWKCWAAMAQLPIRQENQMDYGKVRENTGADRIGSIRVMQVPLCVVRGCYSLGLGPEEIGM